MDLIWLAGRTFKPLIKSQIAKSITNTLLRTLRGDSSIHSSLVLDQLEYPMTV